MFQDGDKVIPTPRAIRQFPNNNFGTKTGTISLWGGLWKCKVKWDGGGSYLYDEEHVAPLYPISLENE